MPNRAVIGIDRLIKDTEARLDRLRNVRSLFNEDPSLAEQLSQIFLSPTTNGIPNPLRSLSTEDSDSPQLDRVVAYFRVEGPDAWRSVKDIADGTGLTRNAVNFILYTSRHKERFEGKTAGPKKKLWRLKPETKSTVPFKPTAVQRPPKYGPHSPSPK